MTEEVSRVARAVREGLDAMRLRASRWGAPRPRFWIDERTTKSCFECGVAFSLVTRKHHCRACGRVFCQKCSSHALPPRDDPGGPAERACDVCFASHAAAAEPPRASTSSAEKRVSARSPRVPDAALSRAASERLAGSNPTSAVSSRPASASASRRTGGRGSANGSESESDEDEDESESDEDDDDHPAERPDADAERPDSNFRDGALPNTATTHLAQRRDARVFPSETRRTASEGAETRDETATPTREARRERLKNKPPKRYRAGKPAYAAHAAHAAALADESLWAPPPPPRFEPGPRSSSGQTTTTRDDAPVNAALFRLAARFLRRAFGTLGDASFVVHSETKTDGSVRAWTRFVAALALECARAVEPSRFVFPEFPEYPERGTPPVRYDMDPLSYVSIQKVASGTPARSCVARDAWSLRRNVADRRMAKTKGVVHVTSAEALVSRFLENDGDGADARPSGVVEKSEKSDAPPENVRVALLGGALEYQRATDKPRLASFSTLLDQEHEHLRAATARALVSKPDVALVERTVARFARDLFLERGVSLALGIGAEELRRLAFRLRARSESSLSSGDSSRELPLAADGGSVRGVCAGWSVETLEETLAEVNDGRSTTEGTATTETEKRSSSPDPRRPATT